MTCCEGCAGTVEICAICQQFIATRVKVKKDSEAINVVFWLILQACNLYFIFRLVNHFYPPPLSSLPPPPLSLSLSPLFLSLPRLSLSPPPLLSQIEECLVCSEIDANVLFKPCLHMIACDSKLATCAPRCNLIDFPPTSRLFVSDEEVCQVQNTHRDICAFWSLLWWQT